MQKHYNIFISHSWAYGNAYDQLVKMLDNDGRFLYRNYSIPKDDPIHNAPNAQALTDAITEKVTFCHVVIILAGVYATYSTWINKEIAIAQTGFATPKPILAIQPWGSERTSKVVQDKADEIVGWNTAPIVRAIRDLANG